MEKLRFTRLKKHIIFLVATPQAATPEVLVAGIHMVPPIYLVPGIHLVLGIHLISELHLVQGYT
jgi:hypothetical protein